MKLPKDPSYLLGIKALLKIAGFSQNGRNRIMRLTGDEISILCKSCPEDAYSTETGRSVHGKLDSRSVATRGLFFTPDLWV